MSDDRFVWDDGGFVILPDYGADMNIPAPQLATDPPVSEAQRRAMEAAAHGHSTLGISAKVGKEFVGKDGSLDLRAALKTFLAWVMQTEPDEDAELDAAEDDQPRDEDGNFSHAEMTGFPVGGYYAKNNAGEIMRGKKWTMGTMPPRFSTAEKAEAWGKKASNHAAPAQDAALALDAETVKNRTYDDAGRLHIANAHISKSNVCGYLGSEINAAMQDDPGWAKLPPDQMFQLLRDPAALAKSVPTWNGIQVLLRHIPVSADDPQKDDVVGTTGTNAEFNEPYLDNELIIWSKDGIEAIENETQKELSPAYTFKAEMVPGIHEGVHFDGSMYVMSGNHICLVKKGRTGPDVVVGDSAIPETRKDTNVAKSMVLSRTATRIEGALCTHFANRGLAFDAMPNFKPILAGVTAANFTARLPTIWRGAKDAACAVGKDKWGKDAMAAPGGPAGPDDVAIKLLDMLAGKGAPEEAKADDAPVLDPTDPVDPNAAEPAAGEEPDENAEVKEVLKGLLSPEDFAKVCAMMDANEADEAENPAEDETPEEKAERERKEKEAKDALEPNGGTPSMKPKGIDKKAMDAAIATASAKTRQEVIAQQRDIRLAEIAVRPYVGDLALAQDSAEAVYRLALDTLHVDTKGVHSSAFPALLKMVPKPGDKPPRTVSLGMDAAASDDLAKRFPAAARINIVS